MSSRSQSPAGPNFFIVGAEKAGTTSLYELLAHHPGVFVSDPKEPNHFTRQASAADRRAYLDLFSGADGCQARGEASTTYSKSATHPGTARRIAEFAPDGRVLYLTRDPLPRLVAQWRQRRHVGLDRDLAFGDALRVVPEYLDAGRYWQNLSAYRDHFPDDQILVLFLDDLITDPRAVLHRCHRFLALDPPDDLPDPERPRNPSSGLREDGRLLGRFRRTTWYAAARDRVAPASVRQRLKPLVTRPMTADPMWTDELRAWTQAQLREDNERLLAFHGRTGLWDLGS